MSWLWQPLLPGGALLEGRTPIDLVPGTQVAVAERSRERRADHIAYRAPSVFSPIFKPVVTGPTDVAALAVYPSTAPGEPRTAHRAPSYFAPIFKPVVVTPSNIAALVVAPSEARGRVKNAHRMPSFFTRNVPALPEPAPVVLTASEPDQAQSPLQQMVTYWTDVQRPRTGLERRTACMTEPRESWQMGFVFNNDLDIATIRSQLFGSPLGPYNMPAHHEATFVSSDVAGAAVVVDSTYLDWAVINQPVIVINPASQYFTARIKNISGSGPGTTLILDYGPPGGQNPYLAGRAKVAPLYAMSPRDGQGLARWKLNVGRWDVTLDMVDVPSRYGTGASLTTFNGIVVIDQIPRVGFGADAGGTVAEDVYQTYMESLDTMGSFENRTGANDPGLARQQTWFTHGAAERQYWKLFLFTVKGRQKLHLLPTWRNDLVVHTQPGLGDTFLVINSMPDYAKNYWPSPAQRYVQFLHADGTVEYNLVTNALDSGTGTQTLSLATPLSGTAIAVASLMEQVRLSADQVEINWFEHMLGAIVLNFVSVPQ